MKFHILTLLIILSCGPPKTKEKLEKPVQSNQSEYLSEKEVILTKSEWNLFLYERYGYTTWEPDSNDIKKAKLIINKAIENDEFSFLKKPIDHSINQYYRQYIPYINEKGERIIEVNAFCEILKIPPKPNSLSKEWTKQDWKNNIVIVDDGGSCYWQMEVNISTEEYSALFANGHG